MSNADLCTLPYDGVLADNGTSVKFQIGDDKVWFPHSEIAEQTDEYVTVPLWLAVDRGVEDYVLG